MTEDKIADYAKTRVAIIRLQNRLFKLDEATEMVEPHRKLGDALDAFDAALAKIGALGEVWNYQNSHHPLNK